jgi:hypothetical protein
MLDETIPELYETENVPLEEKVIHRRYQIREIGFFWFVSELDKEGNLAFGYANLNDDRFAEWGYISIQELLDNGAELDRDWKPCTFTDAIERIRKEKAE